MVDLIAARAFARDLPQQVWAVDEPLAREASDLILSLIDECACLREVAGDC
jgi:hypothetical protein